MKLKLQFGYNEPKRDVNWYGQITSFPSLVLYKGKKWEFVVYQDDPTKEADHIFIFGELHGYDPQYNSPDFQNIDHMFDSGYSGKCECGAAYSNFKWDHMRFCPKWSKW